MEVVEGVRTATRTGLAKTKGQDYCAAITASSVRRTISGLKANVRKYRLYYREAPSSGVERCGTQFGIPSASASRLAKWEQAALQVISLGNAHRQTWMNQAPPAGAVPSVYPDCGEVPLFGAQAKTSTSTSSRS
eukprot:2106534-Amphidinium_carterae.1